MSPQSLVITTRESPLALCQTEWVRQKLLQCHPTLNIEVLGITTQADKLLSISLGEVGGKGLFVKELEEALLTQRAHLAVHSMKDMPMELPAGLCVPVICEREEVRDVFVSNHYASLEELPEGARLGTSSLRRQSQLRAFRPDFYIDNLRGNVNTRLKRLDAGDFDALILAGAGLKRLGCSERIRSFIPVEQILPAVGQGALAVECREEDERTRSILAPLNHPATFACVSAERALCRQLGGGCHVPVAAYAAMSGDSIDLRGLVGSVDGKTILTAQDQDVFHNLEQLAERVAKDLKRQGAEEILRRYKTEPRA